MSSPEEARIEDTSPDHSRSGQDIAEAIGVAERGSNVERVHDQGAEATSGTAPVERTAGDPEMTEGQVVYGSQEREDTGSAAPGTTPGPTDTSSGVAQSVVAGRASDRLASGEESR
ncbi:MAG: hypothetical protein JWQ99_618 [Blastococcus sp.]|jgi:hypothetical protein|nr:hypothetical protein [Blastococcus sp.]